MRARRGKAGAGGAGVDGKGLGTIFNNDINNILVHVGKGLGTIFNNDIDNILCAMDAGKGAEGIAEEYRALLGNILAAKPGVLAQDVGQPDPVIYRSDVATTFDKHLVDVALETWRDVWGRDGESDEGVRESHARQAAVVKILREAGTDALATTIEACRNAGVLMVASFRMNAEDWYMHSYRLSDLGRAHPEYRIPKTELEKRVDAEDGNHGAELEFTGALDPAAPEVYAHRIAMFRELAVRYDIDGIEFDWRRWSHMISDPHRNHVILTRMVRETREMLDEAARKKGRKHLLLGVRVGPMLDGEYVPEAFPGGASYPESWWEKTSPEVRAKAFPDAITPGPDKSCRDLGLDVRTWIAEGLVDYVCPSLFWPRWPGLPRTREFAALAKGTKVGIYPTLFALPPWLENAWGKVKSLIEADDAPPLRRYKEEFCALARQLYDEGADGISTFNWYFHHCPCGGHAVQAEMLRMMGDRERLEEYCREGLSG